MRGAIPSVIVATLATLPLWALASGCCARAPRPNGVAAPTGGATVPRFVSERPSGTWNPFPAGVAEAALDVAYLRAAGGGIFALDLPAGTIRWRSAEAEMPLLAISGVVVAVAPDPAERRRIRVVVLDAADGATRFTTEPLALPRAEPIYRHVRVDAGVVRVSYLGPPVSGGRRRAPELEQPVIGAFTVDLADGRIAAATADEPPPVRSATIEQAAGGVVLRILADDRTLVGETALAQIPADASVSAFMTSDGGHALVRSCRSGPAPATCAWSVFAIDGFALRGQVELPPDAEPPIVVVGDMLYIALRSGPSVRAVALSSGVTVWEHTVGGPPVRRKPR